MSACALLIVGIIVMHNTLCMAEGMVICVSGLFFWAA